MSLTPRLPRPARPGPAAVEGVPTGAPGSESPDRTSSESSNESPDQTADQTPNETLDRTPPDPSSGGTTVADREDPTAVDDDAPPRRRPVLNRVLTALACALVLFALIAPNRLEHLTPAGFVRIPVEALLYTVFFLALPVAWARTGRVVAVLAGLGLGLLMILKILDIGFYATFNRPFDAMLDFPLAGNGLDYLKDTSGQVGAIGAAIGIVVLIVVIVVVMVLSVRRLTPLLVRRRTTTRRTLAVFTVAWVILAVLGTELVPHTAVASRSAAAIGISHVIQIPTDIRDAKAFDKEASVDAFRDVPSDQLLTGLRGKDVVVTFIESYGRSAVESPGMAPQIGAVLGDGSARLRAAGFTAKSGWLTSPTAGGGSWLAQSTLLSGLWVKNQSLYNKFIASDRMTLNGAFHRADWRTLAVAPGVKKAWPEARVFGFDKIYDAKHLGYKGPRFSWSWMPDQYVLSTFERTEHAKPDHAPMMVEMPLTSSHMPWTPLPSMVDWDDVGDGAIFKPMAAGKQAGGSMYSDGDLVRTRYRKAVEYSLTALISYLEKYGDDNLVMVFLGDHQPIPLVAGKDASHDVPITVIAKDPAVMARIAGWKWTDGLKPGPKAPVWPMSDFRDKFLTAFGPDGTPAGSATPAPASTGK